MKKNIWLFILCMVSVEIHPMLSRWMQRGRNTPSMQRSKPALNKVTPVRTYGTGGQWSWWDQIKYKANRAWSNFMTPAVREKIKEKSMQIITPIAAPIAHRFYEYQERKNEAAALQMFQQLYDNYKELGIIEFDQNGRQSTMTKGLDVVFNIVKKLLSSDNAYLHRSYRAPDSIRHAMNKVLPDGHTLFYHFLINSIKTEKEGINQLFNEYQKDMNNEQKKMLFERLFGVHRDP